MTAEVPLYNFKGEVTAVALIDLSDLDTVGKYRWCHTNGYAVLANRKKTRMHRFIMGLEKGDRRQVDHIDLDRLNNRRSNLRIVTHAQQMQNVPAQGGTSPYRGVSWHSLRKAWRAFAHLDGKHYHLGLFEDELEAARVAAEFRRQHMPFSIEGTYDS